MRYRKAPLTALAITAMSLVLLLASAQGVVAQEKPKPDEHAAHHPAAKPAEQPAPKPAEKPAEAKPMPMQMPPGMKMRFQMMMNLRVSPNDPGAVLALRDQLHLTDQQVIELDRIVAQAHEKTAALLTREQKEKLEPLARTPETGREMHEQMMQQMQKKKEAGQMSCPMMEMMK